MLKESSNAPNDIKTSNNNVNNNVKNCNNDKRKTNVNIEKNDSKKSKQWTWTSEMVETGVDPEILKRRGALYQPPCLADEENFRFQMV